MPDVQLDKDAFNNELLCPVCNGNNLHHNAVVNYHRIEDAKIVRVTYVEGSEFNSAHMPNETSGNPSRRRDGVAIEFWCENCHGAAEDTDAEPPAYFRLQIQQHKGTTYLDWDIPSK
jgi:hypothetical protein